MKKLLVLFVAVIGTLFISGCGSTDSTTNYQISISASPSEGGTVSPSSGQYEEGTSLDISATPSEDFRFVEWQGGYEGTSSSATITVDSDKNIQAVFAKREYALTVNTEGKGTVDESVLQTTSTTDYESGTIVELTANPAEGWKFVEWQDDISSSENPTQITVDEVKEVTAVFEKESFTVNINTEGEGSVTISPDQDKYIFGTEIELTAKPDQNWDFSEWSGDISETGNPLTLTVNNVLSITAIFSNTTFAGGNGTEANPYEISTVEQLQAISDYLDANFSQINDIDASNTEEWFSGKGFKPIGNNNMRFTGTYNGNGYKITNLAINRPNEQYVGLFRRNNYLSSIKNIFLAKVDIDGDRSVGGLIGFNDGEVINSSVTGVITGNIRTGGAIGFNAGKVNELHTDVIVSGESRLGGLIGYNSNGSISNSSSLGKVSGINIIGGLIGNLRDGEIKSSFSESNLLASSGISGGLVGRNFGIVIDSYASGNVQGNENVGGLVGLNNEEGEISGSNSTGTVTGKDEVVNLEKGNTIGGFAGNNKGIIKNSYAIGDVSSVGNEVGGFIGLNEGIVKNSFSEGDVGSQKDKVGGLIGYNKGKINSSYTLSNVSSPKNNVGGLIGFNDGSVRDSYSRGNVEGNQNIGGLVGFNSTEGGISRSYSTGVVTGNKNIGGSIGENAGVSNITNIYWDSESTVQKEGVGYGSSSGTSGLTTTEMTGEAAKENMTGFDFPDIWITTDSYPILFWEQ